MIGVVATLRIQDGKAAEFEAVFKELGDKVRANEPGCHAYQLTKSRTEAQHLQGARTLRRRSSAEAPWRDRLFQGRRARHLVLSSPGGRMWNISTAFERSRVPPAAAA